MGSVVYLRIRPTRFRWNAPQALPTTTYEHPWLMPLVNSSIADVCQQEDTCDEVILGTIERWMTPDSAWEAWPPFTVLGMDEMTLKKGHRDDVVMHDQRTPVDRAPHGSSRLARSDQGEADHMVDQ